MGSLVRFFHFWAGVDSDLLELCPHHERQRYLTQGILVLLTGFFAFMSSGYAIFTVFHNERLSIALGLIWGFLIINFDRMLLLTYSKYGSLARRISTALIRLSLAILIGVVVAHPLVLKLFEPEILAQIAKDQVDERDREDERYNDKLNEAQMNRDDEISKLQAKVALDNRSSELKDAQEKLDACENDEQDLKSDALCELDGTCGSKQVGAREVYDRKLQAAKDKARYCRDLRSKLDILLDNRVIAETLLGTARQPFDAAFAQIKSSIDRDHERRLQEIEDEESSLLSRTEALGEISNARPTASSARLVVSLMFVLIEIIPVFAKIIAPRDSADKLAREIRKQFVAAIPGLAAIALDADVSPLEGGAQRSTPRAATVDPIDPSVRSDSAQPMEAGLEWDEVRPRVLSFNLALTIAVTAVITAGLLLSGGTTSEACEAGTLFVTVAALYLEHRRRRRRQADEAEDFPIEEADGRDQ